MLLFSKFIIYKLYLFFSTSINSGDIYLLKTYSFINFLNYYSLFSLIFIIDHFFLIKIIISGLISMIFYNYISLNILETKLFISRYVNFYLFSIYELILFSKLNFCYVLIKLFSINS